MTLLEIKLGLAKIYRHGCRIVNFTGGEPTLRFDLPKIIDCASNLGMWTSVVTNGSLLTRERIHELKDAGLDSLFFSLDSLDACRHDQQRGFPGLHSQVLSSLRWVGEDFLTGHRTGGIFCVVSSLNEDALEDIVTLGDDLGVYIIFQPYHSKKTGDRSFLANQKNGTLDTLLRLKREHKNIFTTEASIRGFSRVEHRQLSPCHAGKKYFSIDPYGFMHPCVDMPVAGRLLSDDMSTLRSNEAMEHVNECEGCWYAFRAEADTAFNSKGYLEKLSLGMTILRRNGSRARKLRQGKSRNRAEVGADLPTKG
jgi:MoaA/NifB/PqqE/SkfB family radical SAM enzyme